MREKKIFRVQEAMLGMDEIKLTMEGGDATRNIWEICSRNKRETVALMFK